MLGSPIRKIGAALVHPPGRGSGKPRPRARGLVLVPLTLCGRRIFASWTVDFILVFLFGIAFQCFTITPMRQLSPREGLKAALKADSLSLTGWQLGMYGWMAMVTRRGR